MSTAEHPQTDGQAEAAVKVIQKMLRPFILAEQDWEELLLILKFAYNDTQSETTKQIFFYLNTGQHPIKGMPTKESWSLVTKAFVQHLHRLQGNARRAIQEAQDVQRKYVDQTHVRNADLWLT